MSLTKKEMDELLQDGFTPKEFAATVENMFSAFNDEPKELLLKAIVFFLCTEERPSERTVANVIKLLFAEFDSTSGISTLGIIFDDLAKKNPDHVAVKYYSDYKKAL